jgi:hypothetical protein
MVQSRGAARLCRMVAGNWSVPSTAMREYFPMMDLWSQKHETPQESPNPLCWHLHLLRLRLATPC